MEEVNEKECGKIYVGFKISRRRWREGILVIDMAGIESRRREFHKFFPAEPLIFKEAWERTMDELE